MTEHQKIDAIVTAVTDQAQGIKTWEFRSADGAPLPTFTAGAHIDLFLSNGLTRSYSLCNTQDDTHRYVVGIANDPKSRGGSKFIHETLKEGDRISISSPRNNFPLVENAPHVVLIAGGIGITPMYCMAQRLESLGRSWELWYSCRVQAMCAFREALDALEAVAPGRVHLNFDQEPGGRMTDLKAVIGAAPEGSHFYCCGPNPMLTAFEAAAELGCPRENVHVEYFAAKEMAALDGGYSVVCRRSGVELSIKSGQSILDAMLDADIEIEYSCFEGVCGTCTVKVLEGVPDHRDSVLTPEERSENSQMMVCCSGSKTARLVLDI